MKTCRFPILATVILACLPATLATAQEFQPYPSPKVTVEQWSRYLDTVRARLESTAEIYEDKNLVAFSDQATRTFYIFTTKRHPAHPAWITRQMVEQDGQVNVRQIGYFAGAQEPFDALFGEYLKRNEELRENVGRRNQ
ncbi:MAG: hypothetical protein ACRETY_02640 [Steroidobacteraceae bacterium]